MKRFFNLFAFSSDHKLSVFDELKNYSLLQIITLLMIASFALPSLADDKQIMVEIDAIQALSDKNNDEGLRKLLEFKKNLPADTKPGRAIA